MDLPTKSAVVFDLESVIDASCWSCELGFQAVERLAQERFGIDAFASRCGSFSNSLHVDDFFSRALAGIGQQVTRQDVRDFSRCFEQHGRIEGVSRNTVQILSDLREAYLLFAVVSGAPEQARGRVQQLGVERWIDRVVLPEYWGPGFALPHPRAFLSIQNCRGLSPQHCTFVAPPEHEGFDAARRLGWSTLTVGRADGKCSDSVDGEVLSIPRFPHLLARRFAA